MEKEDFDHLSFESAFENDCPVPIVLPEFGEEAEFVDLFDHLGGSRAMELLRLHGRVPEFSGGGDVQEAKLETGRRILYSVARAGSVTAYQVDVLCLAFGVAGMGSMTSVAEHHGVGKQAISRAVNKLCKEYDLPPSAYMKSAAARESYRLSNQSRQKRGATATKTKK